MVFYEVLPVFQTFEFHHFFDAQFFSSNNLYELNDVFVLCIELAIWI